MNICVEHHHPKFKITYRGSEHGTYMPVWLVCDVCMQNKLCFGSEDEIERVELLAWSFVKFALNLLHLEKAEQLY